MFAGFKTSLGGGGLLYGRVWAHSQPFSAASVTAVIPALELPVVDVVTTFAALLVTCQGFQITRPFVKAVTFSPMTKALLYTSCERVSF